MSLLQAKGPPDRQVWAPVRKTPERRLVLRRVLANPDSFATSLLVILMDTFGGEALSWHPTTIKHELEENFSLRMPKSSFDRLMAGVTILTTDLFFEDLPSFVQLANILSGSEFNPHMVDLADVTECAWATAEALLLDPPETDEIYSDDICNYLGAVLDNEGYLFTPKILSMAARDDSKEAVYSFSDDPDMFASVHKNHQEQANNVDKAVGELLGELVAEIQEMPLITGDAKNLAENLKKGLKSR